MAFFAIAFDKIYRPEVGWLQTVILKSFSFPLSGVVDYRTTDGGLKLSYSIKRGEDCGIVKLLLLSSLRPAGGVVVADTPEFCDKMAVGEKKLTSSDLALAGYDAQDIDTFVVAAKKAPGYSVLAAGFGRLIWDIASAIDSAGHRTAHDSLQGAEEALSSLKSPAQVGAHSGAITRLNALHDTLVKSSLVPCGGFEWYELPKLSVPMESSAYEHILTPKARSLIAYSGCPLLFGIGSGGMSALATAKTGENPFENAEDCTIDVNGFYVVGVWFGGDGQYFARLE